MVLVIQTACFVRIVVFFLIVKLDGALDLSTVVDIVNELHATQFKVGNSSGMGAGGRNRQRLAIHRRWSVNGPVRVRVRGWSLTVERPTSDPENCDRNGDKASAETHHPSRCGSFLYCCLIHAPLFIRSRQQKLDKQNWNGIKQIETLCPSGLWLEQYCHGRCLLCLVG